MNKMLDKQQIELNRLANTDISNEEKFHGLAEVLVEVMENTIKLNGTKKPIKYVNSFTKQNKRSLDKLYKDLNEWQQGMKRGKKLKFGATVATKGYTYKMIKLVPKFKRKLGRQVNKAKFFLKLTGLVRLGKKNKD